MLLIIKPQAVIATLLITLMSFLPVSFSDNTQSNNTSDTSGKNGMMGYPSVSRRPVAVRKEPVQSKNLTQNTNDQQTNNSNQQQ